jgi:hypothetical protein
MMTRIRPRTKARKGRCVDKPYLDWLHTQPSIVPSHDLYCYLALSGRCLVTAHHVRRFGEQKDDRRTVPLFMCRHLYFSGKETIEHGKAAFEKRFGIDLEEQIKIHNERFQREEA